ncbi:hypothetical protein [Dokdonella sp.]|uniref:hypothetical protein n=1 Tax=Dokdonella sp. TaxID=2291710 RepID=UPI002F40B186
MIVYWAFAGAYVVAGMLLTLLLDTFPADALSTRVTFFAGWCVSFVAAHAAILVAVRFGVLRHRGLFATTVLLAATWLLFIGGILHAIGNQGASTVTWRDTLAAIDWSSVGNGIAQIVIPPFASLLLIRRRRAAAR